jgi:hypothetical protein
MNRTATARLILSTAVPLGLLGRFFLSRLFKGTLSVHDRAFWYSFLAELGFSAVFGTGFYWILKWFPPASFRDKPSAHCCNRCGYDLRATPESSGPLLHVCPECGATTTP